MYCIQIDAPSTGERCSGYGARAYAGKTAYWPYVPYLVIEKAGIELTRSPGLRPVTPDPTDSMIPEASYPSNEGKFGSSMYMPERNMTSARFNPIASTFSNASPAPGCGFGNSSSFNTLASPTS